MTAPRLEGKVAFISGAAGSIGAATARAFVAEGARVVVSDLDAGIFGEVAAIVDYPEECSIACSRSMSAGPSSSASTRWRSCGPTGA